jgi:hypothetical protein
MTKAYYHSLITALSTKTYRAKKADVIMYMNKSAGILHGIKGIAVS